MNFASASERPIFFHSTNLNEVKAKTFTSLRAGGTSGGGEGGRGRGRRGRGRGGAAGGRHTGPCLGATRLPVIVLPVSCSYQGPIFFPPHKIPRLLTIRSYKYLGNIDLFTFLKLLFTTIYRILCLIVPS